MVSRNSAAGSPLPYARSRAHHTHFVLTSLAYSAPLGSNRPHTANSHAQLLVQQEKRRASTNDPTTAPPPHQSSYFSPLLAPYVSRATDNSTLLCQPFPLPAP